MEWSCSKSKYVMQQSSTCTAAVYVSCGRRGQQASFPDIPSYNPTTCRELSGMVQVAGLVDLACSINHY